MRLPLSRMTTGQSSSLEYKPEYKHTCKQFQLPFSLLALSHRIPGSCHLQRHRHHAAYGTAPASEARLLVRGIGDKVVLGALVVAVQEANALHTAATISARAHKNGTAYSSRILR